MNARAVVALSTLLALSGAALAAPPEIAPNSINMFRDNRGANSVGVGSGDRVQYGANVVGGSLGVTLSGLAADGFVDPASPCGPLTVNANFCSNSVAYNAGRLQPWQFTFTRGGESTTVTGPSLVGAALIPFPTSVTMSGTGLTPTISWQLPTGLVADGFRVNVFDKGTLAANGTADVILSTPLPISATSFTLPGNIGLSASGNYAINFQIIETRNHVAFTGNNAEILTRSNSYFDFAPLTGNPPNDIALPTINAAGVYNFNVGSVGPNQITFIDPEVAIGYAYATGAGDPNFQSLLLPDIGDGVFTLDYADTGGAQTTTLLQGQQFFFGAGGVSAFTVTGIETSAQLDPANPTAFITGLTFATAGSFTGSMTPITVDVTVPIPEPQTYALLLAGLASVALARRRQAARAA